MKRRFCRCVAHDSTQNSASNGWSQFVVRTTLVAGLRRSIWGVMVGAASLLCGCDTDSSSELPRTAIEWERSSWGLAGRSIVKCPTGDCLILHYAPTEAWLASSRGPTQEQLDFVLARPAGNGSDRCSILSPGERWGGPDVDSNTLATFNCCSYAVGDLLNLGPGDWLDTGWHGTTGLVPPFQTVLESFFQSVASFRLADVTPEQIETSMLVRDNDLVCFVQPHGEYREIVHVGRIRKRSGRNWIESKLGIGPVVLSTARQTAGCYLNEFNEIVIYRETRRS